MKKILILVIVLLSNSVCFAYSPSNLPRKMLFEDIIEVYDAKDITGGTISNVDEGLCIDLSLEECRNFYNSLSQIIFKRTLNPHPFSGVALNLYANGKTHSFYINSGVQLGMYGENNYVCFAPDEYHDEIMTIYSRYIESSDKYSKNTFNINSEYDFLKYPSSEWAKPIISEAAEKSLLPYDFTNKFGSEVTREDFCILIANMIAVLKNYTSINDYMSDSKINYLRNYFTDCDSADDAVNMLYALGIVSGKSETEFDPYAFLTREQAAVILSKTAKLLGDFPVSGYLTYSDSSSVSDWAKDSVLFVSGYKIMSGVSETEFAPQNLYTTEQAVATVLRLYNLKNED